MRFHPDFVSLLSEFAAANVHYLVIGEYAAGFHEGQNVTGELDLLIGPSDANAMRACIALRALGVPAPVIVDFSRAEDAIVWTGDPPGRIRFFRKAAGVDFAAAFLRRASFEHENVTIHVLGRGDLASTKRAITS